MTTHKRRFTDHIMRDMFKILTDGDIAFASVVLGLAMLLWVTIGMITSPSDVVAFSRDFVFSSLPFWVANYVGTGAAWVWVAVRKFPHPQAVLLGCYSTMMWSFIAISRPSASFTSGMTLNLVVVFMGLMLVMRSGRK